MHVMSAITERSNMVRAYQRVCRNKGAPGVDGVSTDELKGYLKTHWQPIKQQLLDGRYHPQPVRKVDIPKSGGGTRMLGIPCVIDRLIQQAMHQVLSDQFEAMFSPHSYGFRPRKRYIKLVTTMESGKRWVVDIDMKKFFDRVNHEILMSLLSNIRLHELDMELTKRGHAFCRYADHGNIYVRS